MSISVAEYLGQRTDIDKPFIKPVNERTACPFMVDYCPKISNNKHPLCSVRKTDGSLWITCKDRFCSTTKNTPLSDYQKDILLKIAHAAFANKNLRPSDVCVKREAGLTVYKGNTYKADYIMTIRSGRNVGRPGPDRFVLEMQGGGETSKTGTISKHITAWAHDEERTNAFLREPLQGTGAIETNAWRRQQEQFMVKGSVAMKTWKGLGIVFCVGAPLFDYMMKKLQDAYMPALKDHNWNLGLIGISEDKSVSKMEGPIPLKIDSKRLLFTNYQTFVQALINQGVPSKEAFTGTYLTLDNENVDIPWS